MEAMATPVPSARVTPGSCSPAFAARAQHRRRRKNGKEGRRFPALIREDFGSSDERGDGYASGDGAARSKRDGDGGGRGFSGFGDRRVQEREERGDRNREEKRNESDGESYQKDATQKGRNQEGERFPELSSNKVSSTSSSRFNLIRLESMKEESVSVAPAATSAAAAADPRSSTPSPTLPFVSASPRRETKLEESRPQLSRQSSPVKGGDTICKMPPIGNRRIAGSREARSPERGNGDSSENGEEKPNQQDQGGNGPERENGEKDERLQFDDKKTMQEERKEEGCSAIGNVLEQSEKTRALIPPINGE